MYTSILHEFLLECGLRMVGPASPRRLGRAPGLGGRAGLGQRQLAANTGAAGMGCTEWATWRWEINEHHHFSWE